MDRPLLTKHLVETGHQFRVSSADAMIRSEVKACVDKIIREIAEEYITITYKLKQGEE